MRITQGTFSFLPDLTDDEIRAQVDYALSKGVIVVASAGNEPVKSPTYPAAYPEVTAVTALERNGQVATCCGDFGPTEVFGDLNSQSLLAQHSPTRLIDRPVQLLDWLEL